jgi:hypothetical protein
MPKEPKVREVSRMEPSNHQLIRVKRSQLSECQDKFTVPVQNLLEVLTMSLEAQATLLL